MVRFLAGRLLGAIPTLLLVCLLTFSLMRLIPGDAAAVIAGSGATADEVERIREQLGLNLPIAEQLIAWFRNLAVGDLGRSILLGQSVWQAIVERLPVTISLALLALLMTVILGISAGIAAGSRPLSWIDQTVLALALIGVSVPNFWLSLSFIALFSVALGLFPTGGYTPLSVDAFEWGRGLILPAIALALPQIGIVARTTRATMLEVLRQDYIRTANAKGLSPFRVIALHALKNVLIPVLTVIGISFGVMISGSVVIETVFSLPGFGRLLASAILGRDYPVIQGGLLIAATFLVMLNIAIDLCYGLLDPRLRYDR